MFLPFLAGGLLAGALVRNVCVLPNRVLIACSVYVGDEP